MKRETMIALVSARMVGSQEPAPHTHIECYCPDREHRRVEYDVGCFCPGCAALAAVALGYPPTDTEQERDRDDSPDDQPRWCETCGRLITTESITPDGALAELAHYETGLGFEKGEPKTPDDWRVFLLLVEAIADEHLPRVQACLTRVRRAALTRPVNSSSPASSG